MAKLGSTPIWDRNLLFLLPRGRKVPLLLGRGEGLDLLGDRLGVLLGLTRLGDRGKTLLLNQGLIPLLLRAQDLLLARGVLNTRDGKRVKLRLIGRNTFLRYARRMGRTTPRFHRLQVRPHHKGRGPQIGLQGIHRLPHQIGLVYIQLGPGYRTRITGSLPYL